jgi:hypothetical protein
MPPKYAVIFSIFVVVCILIGTPIMVYINPPWEQLSEITKVLIIILPLMALVLPIATIASWNYSKWLMKKYREEGISKSG